MKLNNLSSPPSDEPWKQWLSRIASEAIPYLIPASTAFLLWLAKRRDKTNTEKENLQKELDELKQREKKLEVTQASFRRLLELEDAEYRTVNRDLDKIAEGLKNRQDIYCSVFKKKEARFRIEKQLLDFSYTRHYDKDLNLYLGLKEIFENDNYCGGNREENGCLMWTWLDFWRTKSKLLKYEKASSKMLSK